MLGTYGAADTTSDRIGRPALQVRTTAKRRKRGWDSQSRKLIIALMAI
jgi:hypothetical protein